MCVGPGYLSGVGSTSVMHGNPRPWGRIWIGLLALSVCAQWCATVPTVRADQARENPQDPLPVTAEELMPLEARHGVYLVTEGPIQGSHVPFTFEPHGDRWVLAKQDVARHELHRDRQGNLVIDREIDLREDRQIDYASPVMLVPATVDRATSLTGKTRVTVRSLRTPSVTHRGVCVWGLDFVGVSPVETSAVARPVYRLRATREIRLPLAQISMTIDFEYVRGTGMVATGVDQVIRALGLFTDRDRWRLEQVP